LFVGEVCHAQAQEGQGLMKMGESDMSDQDARAHFKVGTSLYEAGRFQEAASEWEQAYALSKRDVLLYNIYVANRDASDLPKAIDALQRYLGTQEPDAKQRLNLQARLTAMRNALAAQQQPANGPADTASSTPAAPAPAPEASTPAAPPVEKPETSHASSSVIPLVLVITGGALLAGSLVTGLVTQGKVSTIEDNCPKDTCRPGYDLPAARSSARTLATLTDLLLAGGAVVTGVGVVLWLTQKSGVSSSEHASARARVTPALACAVDGCVGSVSGRF
jgi:tetratricopeptide (TPR) repeat protein